MKKIPLFAVCLLIAQPALSTTWIEHGQNDEYKLFIEDTVIKTAEGRLRAWTKKVYFDPKAETKIMMMQMSFDCENGISRNLAFISYRQDDSIKHNLIIPEAEQEDKPVVPDSIGEVIYEFICAVDKSEANQ